MKLACLSLLVLCSLWAQAQPPTQNFVININGKEYTVEQGQQLKVHGTFTDPTVSVKPSAFKHFDNGTVAFNFPANFSFEQDSSEGFKSWSMDGNNFVITVFELDAGTLDAIVDAMVKKFERKNCKISAAQKKFGPRTLNGKQLLVTLADTKVAVDVYEVTLSNGKQGYLVFNDTRDDKGAQSAEGEAAFKVLDNTIQYK